MRYLIVLISFVITASFISFSKKNPEEQSWIRINQLGYKPSGIKVGIWCSKENKAISKFELVNASDDSVIFIGNAGKDFGAYGPFFKNFRLNFSSFKKPGKYYLRVDETRSPEFFINDNVYDGAADFCLRYMRQQRSGFNPFLKDSCHTHDGYVLYGEKSGIKDSTHIDVVGGWHDASDYLQYASTSANATYHLLMAYRDFPDVFSDEKLANGLDGKNGMADVLDEAKWGLDWLLKMHPREDWMFNQVGDDRDHISMRIPSEDSQYGKGFERPVYFINGEPQQRGKFMNNTTGTSSTAGKFSSAFALGAEVFKNDDQYSELLINKSISAYAFSSKKPGVTQTVSVKSPYIYAEDNWVDDLELSNAALAEARNMKSKKAGDKHVVVRFDSFKTKPLLDLAFLYAKKETVTPWLGADTAKHYQWYPFINLGHYELAKQLKGKQRDSIIGYYREGIKKVWNKAKQNAFYRGIPFIWCSNNLTAAFAIQCYWYRQLAHDKSFEELEQANFDWLFGCNPWGTSMVYGLPATGDTPIDPHSAFTHLKNYPIDGGLVDGPVYTSIYKNLIGIKLSHSDTYQPFQSDLAVYHDDYGDYSTNEPTMDGTASLIYLLAAEENQNPSNALHERKKTKAFTYVRGGIIRGDSSQKKLAIVFTGDEFSDGGNFIAQCLQKQNVKASFFFTGNFYNNVSNHLLIERLLKDGHFLGNHSNKHVLYCDWNKRDSLLVDKYDFLNDLFPLTERIDHYKERQEAMGFHVKSPQSYFLPPYEWYNDSISNWCREAGIQLINFTPGSLSNADYTMPADKNYRSSDLIYQSIIKYEETHSSGLNGFILLMHIGTDPKRTDKFYFLLPKLIEWLKKKNYLLMRVDEMLQ